MIKKRTKLILLYIILLVILGVVTQLLPEVTGALKRTEVLQYENMEITDEIKGYIVRSEIVHLAPMNGDINYYVEDGTKVRKNSKVLDIAQRNMTTKETKYKSLLERLSRYPAIVSTVNTDRTGVVSYYVDGYEGFFTPEAVKDMTYEDVEKLKIRTVNLTRKSAYAGEPVFKICEGTTWYILCWVDPENMSKYQEGSSVKVDFGGDRIKATVESVKDQGDKWQIMLRSSRYYKDFAKDRICNATVITQEYSGIKVRNASIATKDGKPGVYVKNKNGDFSFKPIQIVTSDGDYSLVKVSKYYDQKGKEVLTVNLYDEILNNPKEEMKQDTED